jgi:energy-coupling factor transport system ATP-binding protein
VSFRYPSGVAALAGVYLAIGGGEAVAIVGPNGSGKTTLVKHLDGLLRPSSGRVLLDGRDIGVLRVAELAHAVALGFQHPERQLFARSVRTEVGFGPQQLGRRGTALEQAVEMALRAVRLEDQGDVHPQDLGESRRKLLVLASLLAMDAPILVFDEPTAGLDHAGVAIVERVVAEQRARGRTVIAVSHDEGFVGRAFDRSCAWRLDRSSPDPARTPARDERARCLEMPPRDGDIGTSAPLRCVPSRDGQVVARQVCLPPAQEVTIEMKSRSPRSLPSDCSSSASLGGASPRRRAAKSSRLRHRDRTLGRGHPPRFRPRRMAASSTTSPMPSATRATWS